MQNLMIGQSLDLIWTYQVSAPVVEEYLQMVDGSESGPLRTEILSLTYSCRTETGGLFRMVSRLMVTLSESPDSRTIELNNLMTLLGRYFQIRDDYLNLASVEVSITAHAGITTPTMLLNI